MIVHATPPKPGEMFFLCFTVRKESRLIPETPEKALGVAFDYSWTCVELRLSLLETEDTPLIKLNKLVNSHYNRRLQIYLQIISTAVTRKNLGKQAFLFN